MPRLIHATPKLRHHKRSGLAVVTIGGKDIYLGPYGSKKSKAKYDREIAQWLAGGRVSQTAQDGDELTIAELVAAYWGYAQSYYIKDYGGDSLPTAEQDCIRSALRPLRRLYGDTPANKFGPRALKTIQQEMVIQGTQSPDKKNDEPTRGLARKTINKHICRIRGMFRWATEEGLINPSVYHSLLAVKGLKKGRCDAREPDPIKPVSDSVINETLLHLPQVVADMVRFQRLTGCRPEEVCLLRPCDIEMDKEGWQYRPEHHKTEHHNKERVICIGPRAQQLLRPYLLRDHRSNCFVPSESEKRRNHLRRELRQSPMTPSQAARKPKRHRRRPAGSCYSSASYRRAIHRACKRAGIEQWSPNRIRHTFATEVRKTWGLDAVQASLGHSRVDTTQIYAERHAEKAMTVALACG